MQAASRGRLWWRAVALLFVAMMMLLVSPLAAVAAPKDLSQLPDNLRKYVVGSAGWVSSSWMTSPACRNKGGDWSGYVQSVIQDSADLLTFFQPDIGGPDAADKPRKDAILAGYRELASRVAAPPGYCVDDMKTWAGADPNGRPFGFPWGNDADHDTMYSCGDSNQIGAERAPCKAFYVSCSGAQAVPVDKARCDGWNQFSDAYVTQVEAMRQKVISQHPSADQADTHTEIKSPGEILDELGTWVSKKGMEQVTAFIIEGVTKLWGTFLDVVGYTSPNLEGKGFASVYNLIAGAALALAFLGFIITLATSYKRGYLQYSIIGGIKAVVGATLAGVGAIFMLKLSDEFTQGLILAGGDITKQADWTASLAKVNPLVAVIFGLIISLLLLIATVFLVALGPIVGLWALFGAFAAAGQVHPASSGWLPKWASRGFALCWVKFFMVGGMLLVQVLLLPLDDQSDAVRQVVDIVQGVLLAAGLVFVPYVLWEMVDFVDSRTGMGGGSGGAASQLAGSVGRKTPGAVKSAAGASSRAVTSAVTAFAAGYAETRNKTGGGSAGGGGRPPRPEGDGQQPRGGSGGGGTTPESAGQGGSGKSEARPPTGAGSAGRVAQTTSAPSSASKGAASGASGGGSSGGGKKASPPQIPQA